MWASSAERAWGLQLRQPGQHGPERAQLDLLSGHRLVAQAVPRQRVLGDQRVAAGQVGRRYRGTPCGRRMKGVVGSSATAGVSSFPEAAAPSRPWSACPRGRLVSPAARHDQRPPELSRMPRGSADHVDDLRLDHDVISASIARMAPPDRTGGSLDNCRSDRSEDATRAAPHHPSGWLRFTRCSGMADLRLRIVGEG